MGKAIAISVTVIIVVAIVALLIWVSNREPIKGDLNRKQEYELEKLIHGAAGVIRSLGNAHNNIEETDLLSARSQQNVAHWLEQYEKFKWERRNLSA